MTPAKVAALEAVREGAGGKLFPAAVVEAARDPSSPLHHDFCWDDDEAAHQHRLHQARQLIRLAVTILPAGNRGPVEVRAYISLKDDRQNGGGYRATVDVVSDEAMAQQAARQLVTDLRRLVTRYSMFASLRPTLDDLQAAIGDLVG